MLRVNRSKPRELREHEDEGHSLPGRWVNSHELRAGDCIITRSGTPALITEIRQRFDDAFPVSNLSIIGHHNYAVGDVGVLVHNITVCEETIKELRELYANGKGKSLDELRDLLRSKKDEKGNRLYNEDEINDAMGKVLGTVRTIDNIDIQVGMSKPSQKHLLNLPEKKPGMLGQNGVRTPSTTVWKGKGKARIDVENPNPGQRPGQIHYQGNDGSKYLYDPTTKTFPDAPKAINNLLNDPEFTDAIRKAMKQYLGE